MKFSALLAELRRRNVLRAGALYVGAVWALAQGLAQLFPVFGVPDRIVRWIVAAALIGFPFFLAFAWFYEFTPDGLKRESEILPAESTAQHTGRKLDRGIIAILLLAVVLLITNQFVLRRDAAKTGPQTDQSIAVLPFINESGDKDQQYFSDGMSEDLIVALSHFSGLKVISRNSSFQLRDSKDDSKAIGIKLGVANLLEGSVRRVGDAVRVSTELVKAGDGSTLWSEHYDRPYKDLFQLQDDITQAVATELRTKLLHADAAVAQAQNDHPPGGNLDAYDAYLQGNFYAHRNTEADYRKAIDSYNKAVQLDPSYATAYAQLASAWTDFSTNLYTKRVPLQQVYAHARDAVDKALALDPNLADAHLARGELLAAEDYDWAGAKAEFERALQLAPNSGGVKLELGNMLSILGQLRQSVPWAREALATNPLSAGASQNLAWILAAGSQLDEAEVLVRKAIELRPSAPDQYAQLTRILIQRGDPKGALEMARRTPPSVWQDYAIAIAQQIGGDAMAADASLKAFIDKDAGESPYLIAEVYALRNNPDQMFAWLDRAWADRDPSIQLLLNDAFTLRYKDDPRFAAFCRKVGLPVPDDTPATTSTSATLAPAAAAATARHTP